MTSSTTFWAASRAAASRASSGTSLTSGCASHPVPVAPSYPPARGPNRAADRHTGGRRVTGYGTRMDHVIPCPPLIRRQILLPQRRPCSSSATRRCSSGSTASPSSRTPPSCTATSPSRSATGCAPLGSPTPRSRSTTSHRSTSSCCRTSTATTSTGWPRSGCRGRFPCSPRGSPLARCVSWASTARWASTPGTPSPSPRARAGWHHRVPRAARPGVGRPGAAGRHGQRARVRPGGHTAPALHQR